MPLDRAIPIRTRRHRPGARLPAALLGLALSLSLPTAVPRPALAQSAPEQIAFDAAVRSLGDGFAEKAAADLAAFAGQFPNSSLLPEAILLEARARSQIGQFDPAAALLMARLDGLGPKLDEALYLLGEIRLRQDRPEEAATAFRRIVHDLPNSPLLLRAAFSEALATFRARQFAQAASLLADPAGAFHRASTNVPNEETTLRGGLLLAEAWLRAGHQDRARSLLTELATRPLSPVQAWEHTWLQTSLELTNRQTDFALIASSNLLTLATNAASRELMARSQALRGDVLWSAGRYGDAFSAYTNNLIEGIPIEWQRDALLAITRLPLAAAQIDPALALFSRLAAGPVSDPTAAAARVAIAELQLQQHFTSPSGSTNALASAQDLLQSVITNAPPPLLAGRAWFDLGWCRFASGPPAPAADAFSQAADTLPPSSLRALALFKLADCQQQLGESAAALSHYLKVLREPNGDTPLPGAIRERALYQGTLAALEAGQQIIASELADQAIVEFPNGEFRDDTRVLYGQTLARIDPPSRAREVLRQLAGRPAISRALPEIQLAAARSYLREHSWSNALHQLDDWTRSYPTHPGLARAEFERAWAAFKTGNTPRAYALYTNALARFPDEPAAPLAQVWVGDFHLQQGDFVAAEGSYQLVFQRTNWPVTRLTHETRLMAGRAAFLRQGYTDAKTYFRWLIENGPPAVTNTLVDPHLVARAYFALGDCFIVEPESDDKLSDAMTAFAKVIEGLPNSREALLARGRLAECHLQRAALDPALAEAAFTNAAALYLGVMNDASADIAIRSESEVGLAVVRERQGLAAPEARRGVLLKEALSHLLNVFQGQNRRPEETAAPFWLHRAGLEAARLAESLGLRQQAAEVFDSLAQYFPSSAEALRQRANQLRTP